MTINQAKRAGVGCLVWIGRSRLQLFALSSVLWLALPLGSNAQAPFAGPPEPPPDFQRHIVPLLGTLGCNGRACHGSFQGRGGLRLSLFGYDFQMDHDALTGKAASGEAPRVDLHSVDQSLVLQKPLLRVDHEGGERFEAGSWQHVLLQQWIRAGARGVSAPRELQTLRVTPQHVSFTTGEEVAHLRVRAVWQDGVEEDVTRLCRFRSNNDAVVTVGDQGRLTAQGPGDTHVIAFYDNGVAAVPVVYATGRRRDPDPQLTHPIDRLVDEKLAELGLTPSDLCDDAEFLRRVRLDVTGSLPTPAEVMAFLRDRSEDKRAQKIQELLGSSEYAAWWANRLCDITGCNPSQQAELGQELAMQWYEWIRHRLADNLPYDQLVEGIMLAKGRREAQDYEQYASEFSSYFRDAAPRDFGQRDNMPHYWSRRTLKEPADKALAVAHSFLGVRLQCAQCHKHPWAQWTQEDFVQFSAFFENIAFGIPEDATAPYAELAKRVGLQVRGDEGTAIRHQVLVHAQEGGTVPWRELHITARDQAVQLRLLRSQTVSLQPTDDPRVPIMQWMRDPQNPWFARALVNRVWASYFHRGLVEPTDDLSPANPPSHPQLLQWLETNFIAEGFDLKWLHQQILSSATYQRSWRPNATNRRDARNFSRYIPHRLPAEIVYDILKQATASSGQQEEVRANLQRRAAGTLSMRLAGTYAMNVFGKPDRGLNCDCERVNDPTLLQSVFIQNDPLVRSRLAESGWIAELRDVDPATEHDTFIEQAYLRTVSRLPTEYENERAQQHLERAASLGDGMQSLLWALINTKEFILQH